jgi:hypothetical protein
MRQSPYVQVGERPASPPVLDRVPVPSAAWVHLEVCFPSYPKELLLRNCVERCTRSLCTKRLWNQDLGGRV